MDQQRGGISHHCQICRLQRRRSTSNREEMLGRPYRLPPSRLPPSPPRPAPDTQPPTPTCTRTRASVHFFSAAFTPRSRNEADRGGLGWGWGWGIRLLKDTSFQPTQRNPQCFQPAGCALEAEFRGSVFEGSGSRPLLLLLFLLLLLVFSSRPEMQF